MASASLGKKASQSMPKALTIAGMVIAVLFLVVFGLDLAVAFPFGRPAYGIMNIGFVLGAGLLGFISYMTYKNLR
jgi:hypothetical protein